MATKTQFADALMGTLKANYPWARDAERLDRFMQSVWNTLDGGNTWNRDGEAYRAACHTVGISPRISLKALQALPR